VLPILIKYKERKKLLDLRFLARGGILSHQSPIFNDSNERSSELIDQKLCLNNHSDETPEKKRSK